MGYPSGYPPWYASAQRIAGLYATTGFSNVVSGSPVGPWVQTGGAVDLNASAGPGGLPGFRFNASSGGYLQGTNTSPSTQLPFHALILARVRTPADKGTILCRPSTNFSISLSGVTKYVMTEVLTLGLLSGVIDPTQWQLIDAYFGGNFQSALTISGAGRVVGDPSGASLWSGFAIGGGSSGGVRMDVDIFSVEIWNGRMPYTQLLQYYRDLTALTGVTLATPATYTPADPFWPPQLSSRPTLWPAGTSRTIFIGSWGQSNDVGEADTAPITALSSAVKMFNLAWQVKAATNPLQDFASGYKNPVAGDGTQTSGYQNAACNMIAASLVRNVTVSTDSHSGVTSTAWLPTTAPSPSCLFYAGISKLQEAQFWGQELGGVFVCQGEADPDGPTWLANWQAIILKARQILGLPRLPFFFTQTPSSAGARAYEPNISDPSNNVFFIPTTLGANLQPAGSLHWTATGYELAGQALGTQFLSGYPYYPT